MKINDNEIKEQMRKMTYTMTTVGNLISQNLVLMTAIMNPGQVSFDTSQHQCVGNNDVVEQEQTEGFLEWAFSTHDSKIFDHIFDCYCVTWLSNLEEKCFWFILVNFGAFFFSRS